MAGALDGVSIVDLSWGVAGPVGVLHLAEQGADVVKVEPPGGDPFREHPGYTVWNRSRRSVTLDLKQAEGRDALLALLEGADVLVEAFRPGVMTRLGLDYASLRERFPRLVYCSVPGYPTGHRAADRPAYDTLVAARAGHQHEQPGWRPGPVFCPTPMPSMAAQFLVQLGVTGALLARERTGRGQRVEASLYQGALLFTTHLWQHADNDGVDYHVILAKTYPPGIHQTTLYECADGQWVHAATMAGLAPTASQEEVLGMPPGPDFAEIMGMSPPERAAYEDKVRGAFAGQDRDALVDRYHEASMGAECVLAPEELHDHPQLRANGMIVEVEDPEHGTTTQVGVPVKLAATPGGVRGPQPRPGEHTREVLAAAGYTDAQLDDLEARGVTGPAGPSAAPSPASATAPPAPSPSAALSPGPPRRPLEGVTVLDFGQYLAGPIGPMVLADLGAEVIKVEPAAGDAMRFVTKAFVGCQRGKKDIAVDVKTPEGLEVAHRLVAQADVVHHNMTKGTAERLGLGYETLRGIKPDLVYCNTYAYGEEGPLSHFGGLDPLYQAASGLEYEAGPVHAGNPPLYLRLGVSDIANGIASAQGVLLALYHRERTGQGQSLTTSLLDASMVYTSEFFRVGDRLGPRRPPLDRGQTGTGALYRLYETQDGWIQIAAVTDEHWAALCRAVARADLSEDPRFSSAAARRDHRAELEAELEPVLRTRTSRMWSLHFDDAGVPAEVSVDTLEGELVLFDEDNVRLGLVHEYEHALLGRMRQYGALIGFSDGPLQVTGPPPRAGEHTREILARLGYDDEAVAGLFDRKVVAEPGEDYLWAV